ncbi:MAG: hypothetical protein HKN93_00215 [Acidimicrobiia bacterium]|nr:hypothetical protein [Acidimicrobiia bacterium]
MTRRLLALAIILGFVTAACGDGTNSDTGAPQVVAGVGALPAVEVLDVATSDTVDVSTLLPADKPLLVWFWAPH